MNICQAQIEISCMKREMSISSMEMSAYFSQVAEGPCRVWDNTT